MDRKPLPISEASDADLPANNDLGNTIPSKGFSFFRNKKSNVINFNYKSDGSWRVAFRGSELLSWREKNEKKAVNLIVVGKFGRGNLASSESEYGDPVYRLELIIDQETTMAMLNILNDGPLKGLDDVRYPVLHRAHDSVCPQQGRKTNQVSIKGAVESSESELDSEKE